MENLPQICVDTTDAFMTKERFGTREEVIRWIKEVGINNKVTVVISRSDTETGKRGRSNKIIFGCDKGRKHKISDSGTQSASKKCGCPFKIRLTPAKDGSGWKIDVKCGLHNHGLPDRLEGHSFIGRLTTDKKQHVADLAKRHVTPRHILLSLQDNYPENVTRITQSRKKDDSDCDVYRDPSYHEYVDKASQSSQRQSQSSQRQSQPSQTSKKIKLSNKQPQFILQFPNHIRVIASLHGYGEDGWPMVRRELGLELIDKDRSTLYDKLFSNRLSVVRESLMIESFGSQPPEKWMSLLDMGYLIANRYNVVLVCLGNSCMTFFPMTSSHSPNVSIYCIGFVNRNHWVQVNMKEGFPLPPVTLDWKKFRSHITTTWMLEFAGRMQH
ncbi:hypothetical protein KIW84_035191 [Lathyrus oleraceus]|uniref:Protein FAR1-RELATED SEQUENCE n=1 Tax=Pisum sativum TaxID=3888 RepID=A0A9D4Y5Z5_PEA|nr:hypothetical protein KIW84_035191 [Pisum sativum]